MYCVIVGDIIRSKSLESGKREESTDVINSVLAQINLDHAGSIMASFGIVRGDAFEGVLFSQQSAPQIIQQIIKALYEKNIRVRISAAAGELSVVSSERNQADGQAFHIANSKIEQMRQNKSDHWFQVAMVTNTVAQPLVDGTLGLLGALTKGWTDKQARIVWAMMDWANKQNVVSEKLGVTPSVVYKQLKAAQYEAYQAAWAGLEQYLTDQEEASVKPQKTTLSYTTYYNIARRRAAQGKHAAAVDDYQEALRLAKEQFGEDSPNLAAIYNGLASACLELIPYPSVTNENKKELRKKATEAIDASLTCQSKLPKAREEYVWTLILQGICFAAVKKYDEALAQYYDAMEITKNYLGEDHSFLPMCYGNIANIYWWQKDYSNAIIYYQKSLLRDDAGQLLETTHNAKNLFNIGVSLMELNRAAEARETLEKARMIFAQKLPAKHEYFAKIQSMMDKIDAAQ